MNSKFLKAILHFSLACGVFLMGQEAFANTKISIEEAKTIALTHAKIADKDAFFSKTELDTDDGITEYEIEFFHNNVEYDYEINATTGEIIKFEKEISKK